MSKLSDERERRGWSRERMQSALGMCMEPGAKRALISCSQIGRWERSGKITSSYWREKVCDLYSMTAEQLGIFTPSDHPLEPPPQKDKPPRQGQNSWKPPLDIAVLPLPPSASGLVGREAEQQWLDKRLLEGRIAGIWAFAGMGGVGKTALVAHTLPRLWKHFKGGVAVIRANEVKDAYVILRQLVEKFVPHATDLLDEGAATRSSLRTALIMTLTGLVTTGQRVLVAIDNVEHDLIPHIKPILDMLRAVRASVVITSREEIDGQLLDARLEVSALSDLAARNLFATLALGRDATPTKAEALSIATICRLVGNHAQAIVLAAADLAQRPLHTVSSYCSHLQQAPSEVLNLYDRLSVEAPNGVRLTFASSFQELPLAAQRIFAALGVLGGPSATVAAICDVGATLGLSEQEQMEGLDALILTKLVRRSETTKTLDDIMMRRVELHPLVQQFARELFTMLDEEQRDALRAAFARHYLKWIAGKQEEVLRPDDTNLMVALDWASKHLPETAEILANLLQGLEGYWRHRLQFDQMRKWLPLGLVALEHLDASWLKSRADMAHSLARAYYHAGQIPEARQHYEQSLLAYEELGHLAGQGLALHSLGILTMHHGKRRQAQQLLSRSLRIRKKAADKAGEAQSLSSLGFLLTATHPARAHRYFERSLALRRTLNLRREVGITLRGLGRIAYNAGDQTSAHDYFSESLRIFRDVHFRQDEAVVLRYLGDIHRILNRPDQARDYYQDSLDISVEIGEETAATTIYYLLGLVAMASDEATAEALFTKCLENATRTVHPVGKAYGWLGLGMLAERRGELSIAEMDIRTAYTFAEEADDAQSLAEVGEALAHLLLARGQPGSLREIRQLLKITLQRYSHLGHEEKKAQIKSILLEISTI